MKKGQVSQEIMLALGILIILFFAVLVYYYDRNDDVRAANELIDKRHDCMLLSAAITSSYTNLGSETNITLFHDTQVRGSLQLIRVDDYRCTIPTNSVVDANLTKGIVFIRNTNKTVFVENEFFPE